MLLIAGVAGYRHSRPIAIAGSGGDVDTLEKLWPGVPIPRRSLISSDPNVAAWVKGSDGACAP